MTVIVKCQYTGIEFEASSKRSKNHPLVAKFIDEASKDRFHVGAYAKAKSLLAEAKGQSDDINEIMTAVRNAFDAWCSGEAQPKLYVKPKYYATRGDDDYEEMTDGNAYGGSNPRYQ